MKKTRKGSMIALAVVSLLCGCTTQKLDMETPIQQMSPRAWSSHLSMSGTTTDVTQFWEAWNDSELLSLIKKAKHSNADVLTAFATLKAARANLKEVNASLWPTANVSGEGSRRRSNGDSHESWSGGLDVIWTLNLAGGEKAKQDAKYFDVLAKAIAISDVQEVVALETAQTYIRLRSNQVLRSITRSTLKNYEENADLVRWRVMAGLATQSELEDALSRVASTQAQLRNLKAIEANYRNALARLTAQPLDKLVVGVGEIPRAPIGLSVDIPAQTLMRRPDIRSARAMLLSAGANLEKAQSDFFPTLSLSGSIGTQAATVGALGASGSGIASLIGALSLPVLNWGGLQAREELAESVLDEAKARYLAVIVGALEETDNALHGIKSAQDQAVYLEQALQHAQRAYELALMEYKTGIGDYAMLLEAQRSLLTAQESVKSNEAELSLQHVALYRALGGAWNPQEVMGVKDKEEQHHG